MSLVPLMYPRNDLHTFDFSKIIEADIDDLAHEASTALEKRLRKRKSARGFVTRETLQSRIHKVSVQLSIRKRSNPIAVLERRYVNAPKLEVERLKRVNTVFKKYLTEMHLSIMHTDKKAILFGQSLELIHELMDSGYYVFTHGQALRFGVLSDVITGIWRTKQKEEIDPFHRIWRAQGSSEKWMNVAEYWKSPLTSATDEDNRHSILCADAIFTRNATHESALGFFWRSTNIWSQDLVSSLRTIFFTNDEEFKKRVHKFSTWLQGKSRLNVIAIPKNLLQDENTCFVYRSHAYGRACTCYKSGHESFIETLEKHQQNIVEDCASQYRILTYPLDLHQEVRTFTFDELSPKDKDHYDSELKFILSNADLSTKGLY